MAASKNAVAVKKVEGATPALDKDQVLRASKALLRKIQSDTVAKKSEGKANLLEDADEEDAEDELPVWLILTTKKHVIDKKRLKPSKIALPHPYLNASDANLRICLITADPQRKYKDLVADPSFPTEISQVVRRVIDVKKLASKYKSFESRRQLFGEHDVFLADDRIITRLPKTLGKVFYKSGSKRPIPISLEGKRQDVDEEGNKRRKLSEGGAKVVRSEVKPTEIAREIERTLNSALVHLAPSTTTAVKVGVASMEPEALQENVEAVVSAMVERFVPQKWSNLRAVHIKGPSTVALPIWLAEELWETEQDVLEEPLPAREGRKKRPRSTLEAADESKPEIIEVPGPDGELRQIELPSKKTKSTKVEAEAEGSKAKKQKKSKDDEGAADALKAAAQAAEAEKKEKAARKAALQKQKSDAKSSAGKKVKSK